ncbi:unnamed protein product, partial [Prunus brigantina]
SHLPHSLSLSPSSPPSAQTPPPLLLFTETETATQPPHPGTSALETGPVRLVVKSRTRTTQFPRRKPRISATIPTSSNQKFPIVAPPPPPSVSGKTGTPVDRTQQAGPSRGRAAWDCL